MLIIAKLAEFGKQSAAEVLNKAGSLLGQLFRLGRSFLGRIGSG